MSKLRIVLGVFAALLLLYLVDGFALYLRHDPVGSIVVQRYDAIPEKNGKVEFALEQPVAQPCVRALFPHRGDPPCRYLSRHAEQRINF
jgi:hypothetical protein